jgi:endonuclease/exonuclease/phosphatase family metal-dependent hydrolase
MQPGIIVTGRTRSTTDASPQSLLQWKLPIQNMREESVRHRPDLVLLRILVLGLILLVGACAPPSSSRMRQERAALESRRVLDAPEVEWVLAPAEADRERLDAWWSATGKPVFHLSSTTGGRQTDSLVVIAWNLHCGGGDVFALVDDLRRGHLTGTPVDHFVLLVQEAFRIDPDLPAGQGSGVPRRIEAQPPSGPRHDIVDIARSLDLWMLYVPSMRNGPIGSGATEEDRGSAILSTLPLHDTTAIELPFESQRRVAVAATVQGISTRGNVWNLRVCSAHLDPRSAGMRFFSSFGSGRQHQARFLVQQLPGTPAVVAGDLNTWSFRFMETGLTWLRKAFPSTPSPKGKSFTIPFWTDRRLDHMFFRLPDICTARYVLVHDTYGSDHRPLIGWITCGN